MPRGATARADAFHHGRRRPPAQVHADDGQLRAAGLDHQGLGQQAVEHAFGEPVMPGAIAPHRHRPLRRDVALRHARLEAGSRPAPRRAAAIETCACQQESRDPRPS